MAQTLSLDQLNYNKITIPTVTKKVDGFLPDISSKNRNAKKKITFVNQPPRTGERQNTQNVNGNKLDDVAPCNRNVNLPTKAFNFFFCLTNFSIKSSI